LRSDTATTLGIGGLFISTRDPLPVGTIVRLRFRLAGGPHHEIEGHVVWRHVADEPSARLTCGMGVEFARDASTSRLARELGELDSPGAD
jgi:Tfp pilus assembly protein PilZ